MGVTTRLRDGALMVITLDEPERRNPLGHSVRLGIVDALSAAEGDDAVRGVVLRRAGGHFSVGGDIRDRGTRSIADHRERFARVREMVARMVRFSKPLVAAVEGWAAGGGFAVAIACPTVVASRDARFTAGFTRIGLVPDMGLLATLPARIGAARARHLILSNAQIGAEDAAAMGLVDGLADPGDAEKTALAAADDQARAAPLPRRFVLDWFAQGVDAALEYERQIQPFLLNSDDAAEGRAAFFEKRPPRFRGR
ncbi:enoyl-CoA hydratase/isomerase family protein [Palleronia rufa]|uniref:enoyl-CoA hydratase/isomerase family protein n=1 Tax=Palleronia rufa TaxID=1530186 RepID=UPI00055ABB3B|nr:enoyl-CoA hydratase/isomerase family protein [Palleronia rufa]